MQIQLNKYKHKIDGELLYIKFTKTTYSVSYFPQKLLAAKLKSENRKVVIDTIL